MPQAFEPYAKKLHSSKFSLFYQPVERLLAQVPLLESRGDRPLKMTFEDQLKALIFFHLEEHTSGRHLVKVLQEDDFARQNIAPENGIKKSSFFEAINERGLEQLEILFQKLCIEAAGILPSQYGDLGDLVAIDGSLIDAVLSMSWADYRKNSKKAKVHVGFDLNHAIPAKVFMTEGQGAERPFVNQILSAGQTGIGDRGYQEHALFDSLQENGKHFVIRVRNKTTKTVIRKNEIPTGGIVFYDAEALLGTPNVNQTKNPVRLVGYRVAGIDFWIATDRRDLSAQQITMVYKLRWDIEKFFAWWKRHLNVYHLIARSRYGLMVQILGGLITYLLLAMYCHREYGESVNINRVRELRIQIQNELRDQGATTDLYFFKEHERPSRPYAKT